MTPEPPFLGGSWSGWGSLGDVVIGTTGALKNHASKLIDLDTRYQRGAATAAVEGDVRVGALEDPRTLANVLKDTRRAGLRLRYDLESHVARNGWFRGTHEWAVAVAKQLPGAARTRFARLDLGQV